MWKLALPSLLAGAASLASAQEYTTSAAFTLRATNAGNASASAQLAAYHAGAAIEVLALAGDTNSTADAAAIFAFNTTTTSSNADGELPTGILVWTLRGAGFNLSSGLVFTPSLTSNVVAPHFAPGPSAADADAVVGFDAQDRLFIYSSYYDETRFTAAAPPRAQAPRVPLYNWYACYTYTTGSYYYQTLAWVTAGTPINPTCEAVNVTRSFV